MGIPVGGGRGFEPENRGSGRGVGSWLGDGVVWERALAD